MRTHERQLLVRTAATVVALACLAGVAGCGVLRTPSTAPSADASLGTRSATTTSTARPTAGPTSRPIPAETARPTPVPSPTQSVAPFDARSAPARPDALDAEFTPEAAAEVGEYFFQLLPYAWATGDVSELEALAAPECDYCASMIEAATELFDQGQHESGNQMTIDNSQGTLMDEVLLDYYDYTRPTASVVVNLVQGPWTRFDSSGAVVEADPMYVYVNAHLDVAKPDGAWKVLGVSASEVAESEDPILGIRPDL